MTDLGSFHGTRKVFSWVKLTALHSEYRSFDGWLFRGQKNADWPLATTLERAIQRLGKPLSEAQKIEKGLVRKFRRQLHLHPKEITIFEPDFMEILAMIQHHGGPTRLLDWSYTFFVAVFFAVEAAEPDTKSCVWAMDRDWWRERARSLLPAKAKALLENDKNAKKHKTVKAILKAKPPLRTVHPLNAFRLSERHVYQQGAFVVPGDISVPFIDNLKEIGGNDSNGLAEDRALLQSQVPAGSDS